MIQFKDLDHSGAITLVPTKSFPNALAPTMTGQHVAARIPVMVKQTRSVETIRVPSQSRSASTEPSPQYDLSCWLYHQMMHMGLRIKTQAHRPTREVHSGRPGDFFYLFDEVNWPQLVAAIWTLLSTSKPFKAELYDMAKQQGGNASAMLYGSPALDSEGSITLPGFSEVELKQAYTELEETHE